jgi:hypothetical protein
MPVYSAPDSKVRTPQEGLQSCLVLKNGTSFNVSCAQKSNFGCEEKKTMPGSTTKMQALKVKAHSIIIGNNKFSFAGNLVA